MSELRDAGWMLLHILARPNRFDAEELDAAVYEFRAALKQDDIDAADTSENQEGA